MNSLPTAEEFYLNPNPYVTNKMIEFAKLHVEAALKEASQHVVGDGLNSVKSIIDDVLNAYPLNNIK